MKKEEAGFSASIQKVAVISIAICILSLLVSFMVLFGFQEKISEKIFSFSGQLIISKYTLSSAFEESIRIDQKLEDQLSEFDFVNHWQYVAYKAGLLKTENEVQGVLLKGVDESFDIEYFNKNLIAGSFPTFQSHQQYSTEVVVSARIANYLGLGVGDKLLIYFIQNPPRFRNLTVSGIYQTGLQEFDERIIFGDMGLIRRLNDWEMDQVASVEVFIDPAADVYQAQEEVFDAIDSELYVENALDLNIQLFDWLDLLYRNVMVLMLLILVVACFSMVSILLILIMERTPMIGVMKSMGASDGIIRKVFLSTGVGLVLRGLGWGNAIALVFGLLQYYFQLIPLDPVNYYMSYVPVKIDVMTVIGLNGLVILLITASLLIPIRIISRIQPMRAIRFD